MAGETVTKDDDKQRQIDQLAEQLIAESGGIDGLLVRLGIGPSFEMPELKQPTLLEPRDERMAYVLRIELDDITPTIWRQLVVPSDVTLHAFHDVVQAVMGWTDSHLHAFRMGPGDLQFDVAPFVTRLDIEEGEEGTPEAEVRLDQVLSSQGDRLYYEYDFGDGWEHTIILDSVQEWEGIFAETLCLAGARACPPEDVGGVPGYEQLLDVLAGRAHDVDPDWAQTLREWVPLGFDPERFSAEEANEAIAALDWPTMDGWRTEVVGIIARMSAARPALVRSVTAAAGAQQVASDDEVRGAVVDILRLLDRVGVDGIKLTQAGYLPPRVVKELFAGLSPRAVRFHPFEPTTEIHTGPVRSLREAATALGLVRKYKGSLVLTPKGRGVAGDPDRLWDAIADAVPLGKRDFEVDAGLIELLGVAAGLSGWRSSRTYAELFAAAGWSTTGSLVRAYAEAADSTRTLLSLLGGASIAARLLRGL